MAKPNLLGKSKKSIEFFNDPAKKTLKDHFATKTDGTLDEILDELKDFANNAGYDWSNDINISKEDYDKLISSLNEQLRNIINYINRNKDKNTSKDIKNLGNLLKQAKKIRRLIHLYIAKRNLDSDYGLIEINDKDSDKSKPSSNLTNSDEIKEVSRETIDIIATLQDRKNEKLFAKALSLVEDALLDKPKKNSEFHRVIKKLKTINNQDLISTLNNIKKNNNISRKEKLHSILKTITEYDYNNVLTYSGYHYIKHHLQIFSEKHKLFYDFSTLNKKMIEVRKSDPSYNNLYFSIKATYQFYTKHRFAANFSSLKWFRNRASKYSIEKQFAEILHVFYLLGGQKDLNRILDFHFGKDIGQNADYYQIIQNVLNDIQKYIAHLSAGQWNSGSEKIETQDEQLKLLRSSVKKFCEKHGFANHLINVSNAVNRRIDTKSLAEINSQTQGFRKQKYVYVEDYSDDVTDKRRRKRKLKRVAEVLATILGVIVGIGEGLVAGVLSTTKQVWDKIVTTIGGFYTNRTLFTRSSENVFKTLLVKGLFTDKRKIKISNKLKVAVSLSSLLAITGAGGFGFLSYVTASKGIPAIFQGLFSTTAHFLSKWGLVSATAAGHISGAFLLIPHVLFTVLAAIVAVCTAVGLANIFFTGFVTFVKEKQYKEIGKHFKETYYKPWVILNEKWQQLTPSEKASNVAKNIAKMAIHATFFILATAICIIAIAASIPFMGAKTLLALKELFKAGNKASTVVNGVFSQGAGIPMNTFFFCEGIYSSAHTFAKITISAFTGLYNLITDGKKTIASIKHSLNNIYRATNVVGKKSTLGLFIAAIIFNGIGQAEGQMVNSGSQHWVGHLLSPVARYIRSFATVVKTVIEAAAFASSAGPNLMAAAGHTATIAPLQPRAAGEEIPQKNVSSSDTSGKQEEIQQQQKNDNNSLTNFKAWKKQKESEAGSKKAEEFKKFLETFPEKQNNAKNESRKQEAPKPKTGS